MVDSTHSVNGFLRVGVILGKGSRQPTDGVEHDGDEVRDGPGIADLRAGLCAERRPRKRAVYNSRQGGDRVHDTVALAYAE